MKGINTFLTSKLKKRGSEKSCFFFSVSLWRKKEKGKVFDFNWFDVTCLISNYHVSDQSTFIVKTRTLVSKFVRLVSILQITTVAKYQYVWKIYPIDTMVKFMSWTMM